MDREACLAADAVDPLAPLRLRFSLPDDLLYLDGNSLGALQHAVASRVATAVADEWGAGLIRSWNLAGWVDLPQRVAARIARLVGADPGEVAVTDSTSANLFKAAVVARQARLDRPVLLTDDTNFPTDRYVLEGVADLFPGTEIRAVPPVQVADHLDADVAALVLTHVDYRTGRLHDAAELTRRAHAAGALAVWDLSHSTGAVEVDLHGWDADLAVGCTYKYLNGGPGAPAFLYAADRLTREAMSPIRGWYGHASAFTFESTYRPAAGADRFLVGTPPILALAALDEALLVWDGLDPAAVFRKVRGLTQLCIELVEERCGGAVTVVTPRQADERGGQVALRHPHAHALTQALIARGVVGDHRPPDLLRLGFSPLYVRYVDVHDAVEHLADVLATGAWDDPAFHARQKVI